MGPAEFPAQFLAQRGGQPVAVGVGAPPAGLGPAQRIGGTGGAHKAVAGDEVLHDQGFVRHGQVEAGESMPVKKLERPRQLGGRDVELEVAPVGKLGFNQGESRQRGVVDCRAEGMGDGPADDRQGDAGKRPGFQVGKVVDGLGNGAHGAAAAKPS